MGKFKKKADLRVSGHDMFWSCSFLDDGERVILNWSGHCFSSWWKNKAVLEDVRTTIGSNGKTYRIDFSKCMVEEV